MAPNTGYAKGVNRGHKVEKLARSAKPSHKKGKKGKRTAMCREIAREVCGLSLYERRILDMIKTGGSA
eukprot:CAMPEP_0197435202 /NCGR_PEP_ID=MMETSP1175-20131217/2833_1 /TAXON_ID=1003142 /ORGANISM="Triceratium dubium, Strain CCMP147" /LENGTH=67 /DNA_ID=CAMNT_0042964167 /DNA_START=73 /DNA_END=272 /DNA_ORIENTATION=+